jgi:hypothetical protein
VIFCLGRRPNSFFGVLDLLFVKKQKCIVRISKKISNKDVASRSEKIFLDFFGEAVS